MYYVYLLRSISAPNQTYIGYTGDLRRRLSVHNAGASPHTSKFRPWRLVTYLAFEHRATALAFERYLKSHSGIAFARKRLWSPAPLGGHRVTLMVVDSDKEHDSGSPRLS